MSAINFIKLRAPEYETLATDNLIILADSLTGSNYGDSPIGSIGTKREYAVALLTLHMITRNKLRENNEGGGVVQSESEGQLSVTFSLSDEQKRRFPDLCTTVWGCELIELAKSSIPTILNRMM
jgi:hypothetical protein